MLRHFNVTTGQTKLTGQTLLNVCKNIIINLQIILIQFALQKSGRILLV